jgi:succinoglycan biosynthesis transport protein ExoP
MTDIANVGPVLVSDFLAILRRRKWFMLMVGAIILTLAAAVVAYWPATYRSTATIMIRPVAMPVNFVRSTATSFAEDRVKAVLQRIMTTQNLTAIIEKYDLYATTRLSMPMTEVVDNMRGKIGLSILGDSTAKGQESRAAIAFTLWFDADSPVNAQRVTNELVTLFLKENDRDRESHAAVMAEFLNAEAARLQDRVQSLEGTIEKFKSEHAGAMPEDRSLNIQMQDRIEGQLADVARNARSLRDRQAYLRAQLARTPPYLPASGDVNTQSPEAQLALLEGKLATMRAKYGEKHPEVLALDRQIAALKSIGATAQADGAIIAAQIESLTTDLQAAKQQHGANHPDVTRLERQLQAMKAQLAAAPASASSTNALTNPTYADIQIQLAGIDSEIALTDAELAATEQKRSATEKLLLQGPIVEREFAGLHRDYDETLRRYLDVRTKLSDAEMASNLESDRVGETLSLAEPPVEPVVPISPNRQLLLAIGVLAAIAGAGVTGFVWDSLDGRVHGWRQVMAIAGQTPFAVIPVIRTARDRRRHVARVMAVLVLAILSCVLALLYIHYVILPLDDLGMRLITMLGLAQEAGAGSAPLAVP